MCSLARFALVTAHDAGFDRNGGPDGARRGHRIALTDEAFGPASSAEISVERRIADESGLDDLGEPASHGADRLGSRKRGVDDYPRWLVKGADGILGRTEIYGRLAAHGRIHHCEHSGGDGDPAQSPKCEGRGETGDVGDHAAADADDGRTAIDGSVDRS